MTKTVEVTDNSPLLAVSECERTEERLRGSENRYRLVAENAADAIWTVNRNMQPTYFSPSITRLLGYSVEEAMARTMEEVFTPDSFELAMKVLAEEMAIEKTEQKDSSRSRTLEFELKRKDGSIVPVEIKYSFLRGPDGQPVEILAIARDITERKRVEEALIESEQKTRTFMDSVTDLFVIAGRNENIIYVNEAMVRTLGYSKEELLGMNICELLSEESRTNFIPKVKELVATGKITTENMWLTKDGKKIVGELVVNAIYDSEGNYSGSRGVFRDITERKAAEDKLRESEEKYRKLFELSPIGITTLDMKGVITASNPATYKVGGYSENEFVGKHFSRIAPVRLRDIPRYMKAFGSMVRGKVHKPFDIAYQRKDGTTGWTELSIALLEAGGKKLGVQVIQRDVTGQRWVEEELKKHREHLEELVKERTAELEASNKELQQEITERKRVEEELQNSEDQFRLVADALPVLISYVDSEQYYRLNNKAYEEWFGHSRTEVVGKHIKEVVGESAYQVIKKYIEVVLSGQRVTYEDIIPFKDGGTRYVSALYVPQFGEKGEVRGFFTFTSDITERKRAEEELKKHREHLEELVKERTAKLEATNEALRAEEKNFRNSLDNSPLGTRIIDKKATTIYANRAFLDIYGYSSVEELRGVPAKKRYTPESYIEHMERVRKRKQGLPLPDRYEQSIVRKDGKVRNLEVFHRKVLWGGKRQFQSIYQDITEQKRVRQQIEQAAQEWRSTFDAISDWISICDRDFKIIRVNKAFASAFGMKPAQLISKPCYEIFHGTNESISDCPLRKAIETKRSTMTEFFEPHLGIHLEVSASPIFNEKGEVIACVHVVRDITERKQVEEKLRESEEDLRNIQDSVQVGVMLIDAETHVISYINSAALEMIGATREQIVGSVCHNYICPAAQGKCPITDLGQKVDRSERVVLRPGNSLMPVVKSVVPITLKGHSYLLESFVDITERKRMEEALQESEERFRDLFENANDLIQSVAPDGHFLYVNKAWREKLGYDEQEVANLTLWDIICPDFIPHCRELFQRVMSGEILDNIEVVFLAKDGRQIAVEGNANCRSLGGKMVASRGIFRDVTERKQVEEEVLAKSRQLEVASRAKSEFLAHMSHELRTPLNVIIGFTELMLDGVTGRLKKEQRQCLNDVLSSGRHLLGLISDVLDLSKIESGKMELRMRNIDLPDIIESLRSQIMPVIRPRKQKLEVDVEKGLPLVYADKSKVRQVLLNLLSNATKFTPDGGKVKIEAVSEDGWCRVSVIDSGTGIKEDDQKKIFEPFSQLDNSSLARVESGTGLGLPITRQIVDRHGGRIWVESECGKGSSFIFTLPLATHGQPHPRRRNKAAGEEGNGR